MKDIFKRHGLFKIIGILFIVTLILTWIVPAGYVSGSTIGSYGVYSIGFQDITVAIYYAISILLLPIIFLFALAIFYAVVSKTEGYKNLISRITKALKGKEILFIVISSLLITISASVLNAVEITLLFVPLIITIILNLKLDKLTAFTTTFGAILVGIMGYTFNGTTLTNFITNMSLQFTDGLIIRASICLLGFVLLTFFNVNHAKKTLSSKKSKEEVVDLFAVETKEKTTKKEAKKIWPIVLVLVAIGIIAILGYLSWNNIFEIKIFDEIHKAVTEYTVGEDFKIFKNIIGNTALGFGNWDLLGMATVLIIASFVVKFIYQIKFDDLIDYATEGIRKFGKIIALMICANMIFVLVYMTPIVPTILNWFLSLSESFNPFLATIGSAVTSLFYNIDLAFYGDGLAGYLLALYPEIPSLVLSLIVAVNGFVTFFAPTSIMLIIGLTYLDIPYGTWMKYIWKFLVGLLVCLLAIFALLTYI